MNRASIFTKILLFAVLVLTLSLAACTGDTSQVITPTHPILQFTGTPAVNYQATVAALATENARLAGLVEQLSATPTLVPTATASPQPTPAPTTEQIVCPISVCSGPVIWELTDEGFTFTASPEFVQMAYDYTPTTRRLLYSDKFPDHGMGPGNISVTNLLVYDLQSGDSQRVFEDEVITKAIWAPDGETFAYILAREDTYELHIRDAAGQDRILAQDVAFTFSFSPSGSQIAFTRESRYEVPGEPGLYIVDVVSGEERQVADVDRAGYGSVSDIPLWSPDEAYIILPVSNVDTPLSQWLIASDGSGSGPLTFGESISPNRVGQTIGNIVLWHPDGTHVIANETIGMEENARTAYYRLDLDAREVTYAQTIAESNVLPIGWEVPGESFWVLSGQRQILLALVPAQEFEEAQ